MVEKGAIAMLSQIGVIALCANSINKPPRAKRPRFLVFLKKREHGFFALCLACAQTLFRFIRGLIVHGFRFLEIKRPSANSDGWIGSLLFAV